MSYFPSTSASIGTMNVGLINREVVDKQADLYLSELKAELGMDSSNTDFNTQLLTRIATALSVIENYTGVGMQPQMITITYGAYDGRPLVYGPVWAEPTVALTPSYPGSTITISDTTGYALSGGDFPYLTGSFPAGKVVYKAGYSHREEDPYPMPGGLVGAVLEHASSSFRTAGVSGGKESTYWKTLAGPFRRF